KAVVPARVKGFTDQMTEIAAALVESREEDTTEQPPEYPYSDPPTWHPCADWPYAVHAFVSPRYELIAFDLPPTRDSPTVVGWEIYTGPQFQDLVVKG